MYIINRPDTMDSNANVSICTKICISLATFLQLETVVVTLPLLVYLIGRAGISVSGNEVLALSKNVLLWSGLSNGAIEIIASLLDTESIKPIFGGKYAGLMRIHHPAGCQIPNDIKILYECPTTEELHNLEKDENTYWLPCFFYLSNYALSAFLSNPVTIKSLEDSVYKGGLPSDIQNLDALKITKALETLETILGTGGIEGTEDTEDTEDTNKIIH